MMVSDMDKEKWREEFREMRQGTMYTIQRYVSELPAAKQGSQY
jgi:hypothetical protein